MNLGILVHKEVQRLEVEWFAERFGETEVIYSLNIPVDLRKYKSIFLPLSTFSSGEGLESAARPMQLMGVRTIYMDIGNTSLLFSRAQEYITRVLARVPEMEVGIMANLRVLIEHQQELAERFNRNVFFPVGVMGNGEQPLDDLLQEFYHYYPQPFIVPCVMAMDSGDRVDLGGLLLRHWERFPRFLFWSSTMLGGVQPEQVAQILAPVRARAAMRYIALGTVQIRVSPSMNARSTGTTVKGEPYVITEISDSEPRFGKLENNAGFVVFDETHFTKE